MRGTIFSVIALLVAGTVQAEDIGIGLGHDAARVHGRLRIEWTGSESCRPNHDVIEGLRRLLGGDPDWILEQDIVVVASVGGHPGAWTLALSTRDPQGMMDRQLAAPTCSEIAQAAALVLSLWIAPPNRVESSIELDTSDADKGSVPEDASHSVMIEAPGVSRLVLQRGHIVFGRERRWRAHFSLGLMPFYGALPRTGIGFVGRVGAFYNGWTLNALLVWLDSQQIWAPTQPEIGGSFGLTALALQAGHAWLLGGGLNVVPGVWALFGVLQGQGVGRLAQSTPSNDGWGATGLVLDANWQLEHFVLTVGCGGGLPFGRPRFVLSGSPIYQTAPMAGFAHLLVGAAFP